MSLHQQGILTGTEIRKQYHLGRINIDPYVDEHVNPNSIDLRLGDTFGEYAKFYSTGISLSLDVDILDSKTKNDLYMMTIEKGGLILRPGRLYLMHTMERVHTNYFVPVLDGKSSIGRLGITVHLTAGYGDTGFDGQYTLEVTAQVPVRIYPGMRFCQMRFHTLVGEVTDYKESGNYKGETSMGPIPSMAWKQFDESH